VSHYTKGRRAEYRTQRVLETAGYIALRTAGSHGVVDVIGLGPLGHVRLISVKAGVARPSGVEREALDALQRQSDRWTVEIWRWPDRATAPLIEQVTR